MLAIRKLSCICPCASLAIPITTMDDPRYAAMQVATPGGFLKMPHPVSIGFPMNCYIIVYCCPPFGPTLCTTLSST